MDRLSLAEDLASEVYGESPGGSPEERLAEAVKFLAEEVLRLRARVAALDGGDGIL